MALVLALQEGRAFYVGARRVVVTEVRSATQVKVLVEGGPDGLDVSMTLTPNNRTELMDRVYAQLGLGSTPNLIKIAIEAPREMTILRDTLYEADGC